VHDALQVQVLECLGDVLADLRDLARRQRTGLEPLAEVEALHEFHDVVDARGMRAAAIDRGVEQRHDARVAERGEQGDLGLLLAELVLVDGVLAEHLHGDIAPERFVGRAVHRCEAAMAEQGAQPIAALQQHGRRFLRHRAPSCAV
jgi:hypothetical protein